MKSTMNQKLKLYKFYNPSFSLSFLIAGLPILFTVREYLPFPKNTLTYLFVAVLLFSLFNFKNIIRFKFYSDKPFFINLLLLSIFPIFLIFAFYDNKLIDAKTVYIIIIYLTIISFFTQKNSIFQNFPKYLLIVSSLTTIVSLIGEPFEKIFYALNGVRFYVGDTKNPNITAFIALLNVLTIIYFLLHYELSVKIKTILYTISALSSFLYILSFSKSAIVGFLLAISLIFPLNLLKSKKLLSSIFYAVITFVLILTFSPELQEIVQNKINVLLKSYYSYFYGITENFAADSAAIRHEQVNKMLNLLPKIDFFAGFGIYKTRADFPLLQVFTDLGLFIGLLNLFLMFLYPLFILYKQSLILKTYKNNNLYHLYKISTVIYIFYLPNLFLHGTPYEYLIWLPILILYKFAPMKKRLENG